MHGPAGKGILGRWIIPDHNAQLNSSGILCQLLLRAENDESTQMHGMVYRLAGQVTGSVL